MHCNFFFFLGVYVYFNPDIIYEQDFLLNFITSERGAGKTFSTLKKCVELFLETGEHFVYVRRTDTELEAASPTLLSQLQHNNFFIDKTFKVKNNVLYINGQICGYCVSISTAYKLKSVSFSLVKTIIFDEFISESVRYVKNEVDKFLSLVETIARMREVKIICLANESTKFNPYYLYFNIKNSGSPFTRYKQKSILIHNFVSNSYREEKAKTKFAQLITGTKYGNFMLENEAIQDDYAYVKKITDKKILMCNVIISGKNICVYSYNRKLHFKIRGNVESVQTINYDKLFVDGASIESVRNINLSKMIKKRINESNISFETIETKNIIENYIFKS